MLLLGLFTVLIGYAFARITFFNETGSTVDASTQFSFAEGNVTLDHFLGFLNGGPLNNMQEQLAHNEHMLTATVAATSAQPMQYPVQDVP